MPRASVLFLCYNQEPYVRAALLSILSQKADDLEIVIGDDASSDSTRLVIEEVLRVRGTRFAVKRVYAEVNRGVVANFNRCAAVSSGDVLIMAAGDDISHPDRVARIMMSMAERPEMTAHYSNARVIGRDSEVLRPRWSQDLRESSHRIGGRSRNILSDLRFCGASASYRRSVFEQFGPIPPGPVGEDSVMALRALILGSVTVAPEVLVDWRWHGSNLSIGRKLEGAPARDRLLRVAGWPAKQRSHGRAYLRDIAVAERAGLLCPDLARRLGSLASREWHAYSLKIHAAHPRGRWRAMLGHSRRLVHSGESPARAALLFLKSALKKSLPQSVRAWFLHDLPRR